MYYCACRGDSPLSALGVAVADEIEGPYLNLGIIFRSGGSGKRAPDGTYYNATKHPNVVDPTVFFDAEGRLWMVYGSYSGGIFILLFAPLGRELGGFSEWIFEVDPFIIAGELEQPQNIRWDIVRQMALYMVIIGQIDNLNRVEHIQQYTGCWAV